MACNGCTEQNLIDYFASLNPANGYVFSFNNGLPVAIDPATLDLVDADNGLHEVANVVKLGGDLLEDTTIGLSHTVNLVQTDYNLNFSGDGHMGVGLPSGTFPTEYRLQVRYNDKTSPKDYGIINMIQGASSGVGPYFGFYTFTNVDHIGYANYNDGTAVDAAGFYIENKPANIGGAGSAYENRAGGSPVSYAVARDVVAWTQTGQAPQSIAIAHHGNGRALTIRAFGDLDNGGFDSNYGVFLNNEGWESIYFLNQSNKIRGFFKIDNQGAYTNPLMHWTNATNSNSTSTFLRLDQGAGNTGDVFDIVNGSNANAEVIYNNGTGDALRIISLLGKGLRVESNHPETALGTRRSLLFTADGRLGIGFDPSVSLANESMINSTGSHQHSTQSFDEDLDLTVGFAGQTQPKGLYLRTIVMNCTVNRNLYLNHPSSPIGREFFIVNPSLFTVTVFVQGGGTWWDGTTTKTILPNSSWHIQSADNNPGAGFLVVWNKLN